MTQKQQPSELLTREQLAEYLGLRPATLATWASSGQHDLPYIKLGGSVRYRRSDVEAWLSARTVTRARNKQQNKKTAQDT